MSTHSLTTHSVSAHRLAERLYQVLAIPHPPSEVASLTAEEAADAIKTAVIAGCICDRAELGGRPLTFEQYYQAVYGVALDGKKVKGRRA